MVKASKKAPSTKSAIGDGDPVSRTALTRKANGLLLVVAALAFLLLGGGVAAVYLAVHNKPAKVLSDAVHNTLRASSVSFNGSLSMADQVYEGLRFSGMSDLRQKTEATIEAAASTGVVANFRIVDEAVFVRLSGLSGIAQSSVVPDELKDVTPAFAERLDGEWVRLDDFVVESLLYSQGVQQGSAHNQLYELQQVLKDANTQERVRAVFVDNLFFDVVDTGDEESINGEATFHYKLAFNEGVFREFVDQLNKQEIDGLDELDADVILMHLALGESTPEVWISKAHRTISRLRTPLRSQSGVVVLDVGFSRYDEAVYIEQPEEPMSILQLISEALPLLNEVYPHSFEPNSIQLVPAE